MESGIAIVCLVWLQATTGTLPKARAAHSATLVDGRRMLVFGGESQDGRLKDVWALDTKVSEYVSMRVKPPGKTVKHHPSLSVFFRSVSLDVCVGNCLHMGQFSPVCVGMIVRECYEPGFRS